MKSRLKVAITEQLKSSKKKRKDSQKRQGYRKLKDSKYIPKDKITNTTPDFSRIRLL
jgi:hypothetical protein